MVAEVARQLGAAADYRAILRDQKKRPTNHPIIATGRAVITRVLTTKNDWERQITTLNGIPLDQKPLNFEFTSIGGQFWSYVRQQHQSDTSPAE